MKKRTFALLLCLGLLSGCGGQSAAPASGGDEEVPELVAAAQAEGALVVYGSCEEDYLAADLYGIPTTYQRLSTGEVQAKIEEENGSPSADVWFGGTTDPYNVAASEGLLEPYEAENASHLLNNMYRDPDGNWYGIYKGILGFMVNRDELDRMDIPAPRNVVTELRMTAWFLFCVYFHTGAAWTLAYAVAVCVYMFAQRDSLRYALRALVALARPRR